MIPPIWFIELNRIETSKKARNSTSVSGTLDLDIIQSSLNELGLNAEELKNATIAVNLLFKTII